MSATTGRRIGEKLVRVSIAVFGLLVLRLILAALPMLKSPILWMPSASSAPFGARAPITADQLAQFQAMMGDAVRSAVGGKLPETVSDSLIQSHMAIFPSTIANTVLDTLIFVLLVLFGRDVGSIVRATYAKFPDLGQILNLSMLTIVVAMAYFSYQGILYPVLWPSSQDLYAWVFLVLGLAPLVGISILVYRNMDHMTSVVMRSTEKATQAPASAQCGSCGQTVTPGTKFCPACGGAVVNVPPASVGAGKKFCASCGAENALGTKFCGGCGKPVAV